MKCRQSFLCFVVAGLLGLGVSGCGTNPNRTERGDVLDAKVTSDRVKAALQRKGKEFQHVEVTATGTDAVTLSGTVPNADAKARAEQIARSIYRVQRVDNQLKVGK